MQEFNPYDWAKARYLNIGVDCEAVFEKLVNIPISLHCWQGDDVEGFEANASLSGGIQVTGSYPGKARNPQELMADLDFAFQCVPGQHRINLHANYAIFEADEVVDRDALEPKHFQKWIDFAKERGLGIDFNPTFFSHPKSIHATLSSEDSEVRLFWVEHAKRCLQIAETFADELGKPCLFNIWIPDGFKEVPADRQGPRARLKASLDQILSIPFDKDKVIVSLESKVFGIGFESYTVGSHEFYMNYAAQNGYLCLLDNGHYHPTESVADKISSMLLFSDKVALHVTRAVRWDSDHVVRLNDEITDIANEVIKIGSEHVFLALDYFDASINRVAAWVLGMRNLQKALLKALLTPNNHLKSLQDTRNFTALMATEEENKQLPWGIIWDEFCLRTHVPLESEWLDQVKVYETEVLEKRA